MLNFSYACGDTNGREDSSGIGAVVCLSLKYTPELNNGHFPRTNLLLARSR